MKTVFTMDLPLRGFFLVTCCWTAFALVSSEMGSLSPPRNISLVFTNDFCVKLSWSPPEGLNSSVCAVKYLIEERTGQDSTRCTKESTFHTECPDIENGVTYLVRTCPKRCGNRTESKEVVIHIPPTEKLVKDFKCLLHASDTMSCTWHLTGETSDLQLYYWYGDMQQALVSCSLYLYSGDDKTGCHLQGNLLNFNKVFILLNGTRGSSVLRNTFQVIPQNHMKPAPPKLRHEVVRNMLKLSCDPPAGFNFTAPCWNYKYRYRSSSSAGWQEKLIYVDTSVDIPYDQRLQYHVQVKAICRDICGAGSSDWSEIKSIGDEQPASWSSHMALIAIPVVVTVCVILFLIFLKKVRVMILPQIPDPLQLFKELINSKEEGAAAGSHPTDCATARQGKGSEKQKLYVPEETEVCVNVRVEEPEAPPDL